MAKKTSDQPEMPIDNTAGNANNQEELISNEDKLLTDMQSDTQTTIGKENSKDGKKEYIVSGDMTIRHSVTIYRHGDHIFLADDECSEQLKLFLSEV